MTLDKNKVKYIFLLSRKWSISMIVNFNLIKGEKKIMKYK